MTKSQCMQIIVLCKKTEYLEYVLSLDGINQQKKKVQTMLAIIPPRSVKELHRFLGMVNHYIKMLAPLSTLVGECRHTKITKANKTKKVPWHWDMIRQQAFDNIKATITKDVTLAYPD